jgi:hypothetical protein
MAAWSDATERLSPAKPGDKLKGFPSDQVPSHQVVVRFKGTFDFTYLYRTLQRWFEQRRFRFYENRMKDTGKRLKVDLYAVRILDEFFTERYDIKVEMWNLTTQEIIVNGEARKILNGMTQFTVKGQIGTDRLGMFTHGIHNKWLAKWLGHLFMDVKWREIEMKYIDVMEYRTQDVQSVIKECLNMTTKENAAW